MKEDKNLLEIVTKTTIDNKTLIQFGIIIGLLAIAFISASNQIPVIGNDGRGLVQNLTNLAPTVVSHPPGTGERNLSTIYWANDSEIQLYIYAHFDTAGSLGEIMVNNSNVTVYRDSKRPLGVAEEIYTPVSISIPKGTNYSVEILNVHHYEWYEYKVLSGNSSDKIIYNQTFINGSNLTNGTILINESQVNNLNSDLNNKINKSDDTASNLNITNYLNVLGKTLFVGVYDFNNRVGIGTNTPNEILNLHLDASNFTTMQIDAGNTVGFMYVTDLFGGEVTFGSKTNVSGNIKTNNTVRLHIDGNNGQMFEYNLQNSAQTSALCYNSGTGEITLNSGLTTCLASTEKLKTNITKLSKNDTDKFMNIETIKYDSKLDNRSNYGFSAENLSLIYPELVGYEELYNKTYNENGQPTYGSYSRGNITGVKYENVVAILTNVVQKQQIIINKICSKDPKMCE